MILNVNLGSSVKHPEEGDIYIDEPSCWASTGYFKIILRKNDKLVSFPLAFLNTSNKEESFKKISAQPAPKFIMPVAHIKVS